ncbi:formin-binding protein 4 [Pieris rapae]|uniref:formin-binding protein 4 n=1 Tax=Pieris rapae TaxID=64459 RepID=UPI001E28111F|nr:formin-binding protein 4 [Pieris rapae]
MNKTNPLGLLVSYGDSDEELEDASPVKQLPHCSPAPAALPINYANHHASAAIHPPPISHCPWSACYDENSGFTYYWNQQTNAVTWEAPPEYLLALKLAQQHLTTSGNTEVSAEEWQLYQQALVEKQNSNKIPKITTKPSKTNEKFKDKKNFKKRPSNDSDDEYKIELITSYHNSDSESNDELESPKKPLPESKPVLKQVPAKPVVKRQKTKAVEFGPSLPENQSYSAPIGPELPPGLVVEKPKPPEVQLRKEVREQQTKSTSKADDEDSEEENELLKQLKDKAKLLEKLGGDIPSELQKILKEDSRIGSPKSTKDLDIDELLQEIEQKELPKIAKIDIIDRNSASNSPKPQPPEDLKEDGPALFPSAINITKEPNPPPSLNDPPEEKKENIYLSHTTEPRKKLRISNSVLPKAQKIEVPEYTTKYSQFIEGFSNERTGLGFSKDEADEGSASKEAINYGNGLLFTRGEVLNEKDEALDDLAELVEAKLKYLSQVQPSSLTPLQEMMVQMQTLVSAFRCGALTATYWRRWVEAAARALTSHEHRAAPAGWLCIFQRSEARYSYKREADGFVQWEYPAVASTDMDICTTPPPPDTAVEEPPPPSTSSPSRVSPPPPPSWHDPPPPGTDAHLPLPPPPESKKEIGDELLSFYNDLAELEKSNPSSGTNSPERREKSEKDAVKKEKREESRYERSERDKCSKTPKEDKIKKKSKVKISSSIGMKQKTVSSLVAKWQQVAEEIDSD